MGNFSYEALAQTLANRTGTPFRRDTSVAYPGPGASYIGQKVPAGTPGGWRLLRIKVTDPGLWLVHCHITMHQIMVSIPSGDHSTNCQDECLAGIGLIDRG